MMGTIRRSGVREDLVENIVGEQLRQTGLIAAAVHRQDFPNLWTEALNSYVNPDALGERYASAYGADNAAILLAGLQAGGEHPMARDPSVLVAARQMDESRVSSSGFSGFGEGSTGEGTRRSVLGSAGIGVVSLLENAALDLAGELPVSEAVVVDRERAITVSWTTPDGPEPGSDEQQALNILDSQEQARKTVREAEAARKQAEDARKLEIAAGGALLAATLGGAYVVGRALRRRRRLRAGSQEKS